MAPVDPNSFQFLRDLKANNNKTWFEDNRADYDRAINNIAAFANDILETLKRHDVLSTPSGRKSLFRINRDVRFSKHKLPYKAHFSGYFRRADRFRRGGYYFHLEPNGTRITGGFAGPKSEDLKLIRNDIGFDEKPIHIITSDPLFVQTFGQIKGEQLIRVPAGFEKDHPAAHFLRLKQFFLTREFTDEEVLSHDFAEKVVETYLRMRPFFDYMSEVLSSGLNGI